MNNECVFFDYYRNNQTVFRDVVSIDYSEDFIFISFSKKNLILKISKLDAFSTEEILTDNPSVVSCGKEYLLVLDESSSIGYLLSYQNELDRVYEFEFHDSIKEVKFINGNFYILTRDDQLYILNEKVGNLSDFGSVGFIVNRFNFDEKSQRIHFWGEGKHREMSVFVNEFNNPIETSADKEVQFTPYFRTYYEMEYLKDIHLDTLNRLSIMSNNIGITSFAMNFRTSKLYIHKDKYIIQNDIIKTKFDTLLQTQLEIMKHVPIYN